MNIVLLDKGDSLGTSRRVDVASATAHWFRGALVYIRELWSESQAEWYGLAFLRLRAYKYALLIWCVCVRAYVCTHGSERAVVYI